MIEAQPSATVALLRGGVRGVEVLLLERHHAITFHGGDWVFPGGRVEPSDVTDGATLDSEAAARRAVVRETLEETGLRIGEEGLVAFSHWITPESFPKRFSTYFFAAEAPPGLAVADGLEAVSLRYFSPLDALEAHARGELGLPPPTWITLHELARFRYVHEALEALSSQPITRLLPRPIEVQGGIVSLYPGDAGYETFDPGVMGARFRLVMCGLPFKLEKTV